MQVGAITIDGRQVGIVTRAEGTPDTTTPLLSDDIGGAYGSPEHYSLAPQGERHHAPRHSGRREGGHRDEEHHHADHRHGPGHYARGEQREKEQAPHHQGGEVRNIPYSSSGNPFDRARFAKELEAKPWLKDKMAHISLGENQDPHANLAVVETMMNRAVVRGTSLEAQVKRHRSSGVDEGGYYAGWAPHYSSDKRAMFDRNLGEALGQSAKGQSNVSNYATDNSSGDLAARERATGSFVHHKTINGESFFSPGHAEPVLRDRWQNLNRRAQDFEKNKAADTAAAKPFDPGTMVP